MPEKLIFSTSGDTYKNAYMNWKTRNGKRQRNDDIWNSIVLADGFMSSALELTKHLLEDNSCHEADGLIYPILFNANHSIELYLKAMDRELFRLLGKDEEQLIGGHNIRQIYLQVDKNFIKYEKDKKLRKELRRQLRDLSEYIEELFEKIKNPDGKDHMDFTRYAFDTDENPQFYIMELNNVVVDLECFYRRMNQIGEILSSVTNFLLYDCLEPDYE